MFLLRSMMKHQISIEQINHHIRRYDTKTSAIGERRVVVDWIDIGIIKESNIITIEHKFDIL